MSAVLASGDRRTLDFESFRSAVSQSFVPLDTAQAEHGFRGRISGGPVGALQVAEVTAGAHTVRRTPRTIRAADPGDVKIGLQVHGHGLVTQDDRVALLAPGEFALYDTARPYRLRFEEPFRMLVLMCPRRLLRLSDGDLSALTARPLSGQAGLGAVAVPVLRELATRLEDASPPATSHLAEAALDLLAAVFAEQLADDRGAPPPTRHRALRARIGAFVEANLSNPGLDVPAIASAHYISVRQLQKIFEEEQTTASTWIRERRLDRCRRDLADPQFAHLPIAAIAARSGLRDPAHFVRIFKARFGVTPGAFRRARQLSA